MPSFNDSRQPPEDEGSEYPPAAVLTAEPDALTPRGSVDFGEALRPVSSPKQHRAKVAKRLAGRRALSSSTSSIGELDIVAPMSTAASQASEGPDMEADSAQKHRHSRHGRSSHIVSQVRHWLHEEKARKAARQHKTREGASEPSPASEAVTTLARKVHSYASTHRKDHHRRTSSVSSDGNMALEKLEQILAASMDLHTETPKGDRTGSYFPRRASRLLRKRSTIASSDTEYHDGEAHVPSADVVLDNSRTLGYSGGGATSQTSLPKMSNRAKKERDAWLQFKYEIVRLSHTLKLTRWRRVPLERSGDIEVERLSGALTNSVYVVSPPVDLPPSTPDPRGSTSSVVPCVKRPLPKLLLRIYGPQVEHLIDRESELQILKRLARKNIGPKMLGTFANGRFEQFFNARTLTAKDLRIPETSKQIAKRMRELHEGIDLLEDERDRGPFIWHNWDKWVQRCEEVISWLDQQILLSDQGSKNTRSEEWKKRGLVCGVEWSVFRDTVEAYRKWLDEQCGGPEGVRQELVFAHNDTQYGNLLRLQPSGESPLLTPANEHKQLVVIDFEYASANVPGLEFANHFTEWCYNYHDAKRSYVLDHHRYPTPDEQKRFLKAYVQHRPHFQLASPTYEAAATPGPSSSISSFMLDSRGPPSQYREEEARREEATDAEVKRLLHQTRMWRIANSAQWVAWGIVQAKVPGMNEALDSTAGQKTPTVDEHSSAHEKGNVTPRGSDSLTLEAAPAAQDDKSSDNPVGLSHSEGDGSTQEEAEEEEFDYLAYAQERAMFFWGDILQLGIVPREHLSAELLDKVKTVEY